MRTFVIPGGRARIDLMVACLDANVCGILLTSKEDATSLEQDLVVTRGLRIPCFSYVNLHARPSLKHDGEAFAQRAFVALQHQCFSFRSEAFQSYPGYF